MSGSYAQAPDRSYSDYVEPHAADTIAEKPSVLDELLPLPNSTSTIPSHPARSLLNPLRRIASLAVIVGFLLGIAYVAMTTGTIDQGIRKAEVAWTKYVKLHGKVFEDMADEKVQESSGMQVVDVPVDETEEKPTQGTIGAEQDDESLSTEDYVWGEDSVVQEIEMDDSSDARPDWSRYTFLRTLPKNHVDTKVPGKRVIFVGDIHGMYDSFIQLMDKISYDASKDFLIHVGDIVAKGPDPIKVLTYMRKNRIRGVRGNHDEKVIEWRNWMVWAGTREGKRDDEGFAQDDGSWRSFVENMDWQYGADSSRLASALSEVNRPFPKDWQWRSEHWKLARDMGKKDYEYLLSLPLALHIPSMHTVVVHAGLLGRDPSKKANAADQPYSALFGPDGEEQSTMSSKEAELSIFTSIKQNRNPYTLLEMRSVLKDGKVTKKSGKGTPWSDIWQQEEERCRGRGVWDETVEDEDDEQGQEHAGIKMVEDMEKRKKHEDLKKLPKLNCSPLTVVYGHAAGRGLDIKQFSKGLDTGCVYGHELTAMIFGDLSGLDQVEGKPNKVRIGEERGVLIDLECEKP